MLHKPPLPRQQQGQVMVEYAIILILSITLLIGGIELAATAFASSKASDGAKAGANEFVEENEKRLTAQQNQKDYLRLIVGLDTDGTGAVDNDGELGDTDYESYLAFLESEDADKDEDGDVDEYDYEDLYDALVDGATINTSDAKLNLGALDTDADGEVTDKELKATKRIVLNYSVTSTNTTGGLTDEKNAKINRYKSLIILEQFILSRLPLNNIDAATATAAGVEPIPLSKAKPLIGDHTGTLMTNPSCGGGNTYNTGLPDNDAVVGPDTEWPVGSGEFKPAIYLFNPKPIDVASCAGVDPTRGNRSRLSILVGGFGNEGDANYEKGLPKLNQAIYGQYVNACLNGADQYVSCSSAAVAQTLLKPPGKLCLSNAASPTVDSCSVDAPAIGTTGYYFWGSDNDTPNAFSYANDQLWFRPTFQLVCNPDVEPEDTHKSPLIVTPACTNGEVELSTIQINTRYRSVFESFLTFGLLELEDANLAQYFFDPSNLRSLGAGLGVGIAGSELGSKRQGGNPTVKPFKDFRGCYEVNVETNQVSACN